MSRLEMIAKLLKRNNDNWHAKKTVIDAVGYSKLEVSARLVDGFKIMKGNENE